MFGKRGQNKTQLPSKKQQLKEDTEKKITKKNEISSSIPSPAEQPLEQTSAPSTMQPAKQAPKKTSHVPTQKIDPGHRDLDVYNIDEKTETRVNTALLNVHPLVMDELDLTEVSKMNEKQLSAHLKPIIGNVLNEEKIQLNAKEQMILEIKLIDDMIRLGPLEPLLADETVTDILVNGYQQVYVERFGKLQLTRVKFRDDDHVLNVIQRIVSQVGRRIDETVPYVDARLKDGSRVNAIINPLAIDGPSISIRKFKQQKITLDIMVRQENLSDRMSQLLSVATRSRLNILVVGGTGSGKTTLLNALSNYIPLDERIITIEDSAELQLQQPHIVRLETRNPNVEGKGGVNERLLVKNALRMRPDRIILGEIRGEEAFDMLQAMNTGHDGSMCTIHASSPREVPARLANMVMMAGYDFPPKSVMSQIGNSINLLVQVSRMRDGKRRVVNITEIVGLEGEVITMQDLFVYTYQGEDVSGNLMGSFDYTGIKPKFFDRAAEFGLDRELAEVL